MEDDPEGMVKADPNMAFAWLRAAEKFGCSVPSIDKNNFDKLGFDQKFAEQFAIRLLGRIEKKKAEFKVNSSQDVHKDYNFSKVPEDGLMGKPKGAIDGVVLSELTDNLRDEYGIDPTLSGLVVTSVDKMSVAYKHNLRKGDLIRDVGQKPVKSVEDLGKLVADLKSEGLKSILLLVQRDGKARFIILKVH